MEGNKSLLFQFLNQSIFRNLTYHGMHMLLEQINQRWSINQNWQIHLAKK